MMSDNDHNCSEPTSGICDRLRFLREKHFGARGKRKFATELGLPLSTYATYEASRTPPPEILVKVCDITGCDLKWLMTGRPAKLTMADAEVSEILTRMEALLATQPKARQAVIAMMDLLATPSTSEADESESSPLKTVIPILGRAAAGLPAIWEAGENDYASLAELVRSYKPEEIRERVTATLENPVFQNNSGRIEIVQFVTPLPQAQGQIDGVILASEMNTVGKLFAISIIGDSMEPRLATGDLVIVDSGQPAEEGRLCLAELRDRIGAVCKVFYPEDTHVRLSSLNPAYEPILVERSQVKWAFKVVGAIKPENA